MASAVLDGTKLPVPDEDQIPPVAMVTLPLNETVALLAQTVWLVPALEVGAGVICTFKVVVTGEHPPLLVDVSVRFTDPASISADPGI